MDMRSRAQIEYLIPTLGGVRKECFIGLHPLIRRSQRTGKLLMKRLPRKKWNKHVLSAVSPNRHPRDQGAVVNIAEDLVGTKWLVAYQQIGVLIAAAWFTHQGVHSTCRCTMVLTISTEAEKGHGSSTRATGYEGWSQGCPWGGCIEHRRRLCTKLRQHEIAIV